MAAIAHPGSAQAVIVHGRVFDNAGHLARGVAVSIIGRPSGSTATANTDTAGRYAATFTDGDSVYVLTYRKVGFAAFTQTARLAGLSGFVDVPDVALGGGPNVLQPIVARVNQERVPIAAPGDYPSVGGTEMNLLANAAFLADPSDISGLALSLPGIFGRGDSGFSVLGAATTQNRTLVDGADFGGGSLPRDAVMTGSVVTSSSDPSRGEFAGGATVLTTRPGSARVAATVRAQLIDPHLAWGDPDAPAPPSRTVFASGFVTGPLGSAKVATYRLSVDASERTSDLPTLLAPRATLLQQEGVSLDSLAAVAHALTTLGTPLTAGGVPSEPTSDRASAVLRIDHRVNSSTSFNFAATGNWSRNAGQGIGELSFPSLGTRSSSALMHYALNGTTYLHRVLESVHVTLNAGSTHADPYLASPAASVLVGTTYADARTGLVALRFGGAGGGTTDNDTRSWAVNNEIAWAASNYKNQLKFTQEIKSESGTVDQAANAFGTYVYQSAADLLANAPASFTRMLSSAAYDYRGTSVALSLGDTWRPRPNILEFQGGLRFDDEYFGHDPAFNAGLDSLFGVRTDRVPGNDGISPRFGFSWIPGGRKDGQLPAGVTTRAIGLAGTRPPPADVTGTGLLPSIRRVKITGSIGAYRGVIAPSQVGALQGTTGLANATTTLSCVGAATPTPDWAAPVIANSCVNGNTTYAATLPTVRVFDPAFHPPVTWRGVLSVAGLRAH
ncbi:MAG TPA: carboxypeptidase-like regulatory domain-containing protein, partial [Gemmatimonadales bacterium]|nr:carboxypeptidase-like regulatory domain-containing protein [Gemmatimonadales bacterium]